MIKNNRERMLSPKFIHHKFFIGFPNIIIL